MKCPYRIEPHQIQGMDFIHIYPVIQWLVKRAIETKEEMGDINRQFSVSQFNKYNSLPEDEAFQLRKPSSLQSIKLIKGKYGPKRRYRRLEALRDVEEEVKVQSTLLEYGRRHAIVRSFESSEQTEQQQKKGTVSVEEQDANQEKRIQALLNTMTSTDPQQHSVTASKVGSMVFMQSDEIKKAADQFAQKQSELEQAAERPGTAAYNKKIKAAIQKQIDDKAEKQRELEKKYQEKKEEFTNLRQELDQLESVNERINEELVKLDELENGENKVVLEKLRQLVAVSDAHKEREKQYKQKCKEELAALESELAQLKASGGDTEEDKERYEQIEQQHAADKAKLQKMKLGIAKKNREISSLQRKVDEVPSRAELSQYQRRFVELYNQVSATHKETKQFYTLYNTLENSRSLLDKEVNLLNSVYDNFIVGMSSANSKDQFLKQLENIVDGIKSSRAKLEKQKEAEKMKRDKLSDDYISLVEKQRLYFKTVKDLKEELRKNEILSAKLHEAGI